MSPAAHRGHHVGRLVLDGCRRGCVTGVHGGSRSSSKPGTLDDVPQVLEVEQAVDLVDVAVVELERAQQRLAQRLAHARADLEAHDLAEAAPAQLLLDGAQQVVGLVVDLEVGVARDAEDVVVDDLHAREERVEVLGDELLERDERAPVADRHEAREHLLRHLHARERLLLGLRVAHEHGERERQVGDVRERPPEPDRQRREHGEDLAPEALVELRAVLRRRPRRSATMPDAVLGERGPQVAVEAGGLARAAARGRARGSPRPSRPACGRPRAGGRCPASTCSSRPATRTMKNSSRLLE